MILFLGGNQARSLAFENRGRKANECVGKELWNWHGSYYCFLWKTEQVVSLVDFS